MKTKYPSMFGVLAALLLVVSFIIPTNLASPSPVQAGVCRWDRLDMPGSSVARGDVSLGSEVNKIAVSNDASTLLAVVVTNVGLGTYPTLFSSPFMGLMWSPTAWVNLATAAGPTNSAIYDVVIAPDDPAFWAVVTGTTAGGPTNVWITTNAGGRWTDTRLNVTTGGAPALVGAIDVSVDYGGQRDIAVGIRRGDGGANMAIYAIQTAGLSGWALQTVPAIPATFPGSLVIMADVFALKFSQSYPADGGLAVVFADNVTGRGTMYNVALRDIDTNTIPAGGWALPANVEVAGTLGTSPFAFELASADLELPSDFNGAAASLRRAYISTDSDTANKADGIFRIDNATVYVLMDTRAATDTRRISTIAYFGTYASGKLLAGEYNGWACLAQVPTWFTDSPTTCPVPCWYPALKPATGAAGQVVNCILNTTGVGNAQVLWWLNGQLALAATNSGGTDNGTTWFAGMVAAPIPNDESALSISRNNGETWNQIAFIDTTLSYFNDFAISADCTTLYLASVSANSTMPNCTSFDSVWRSSLNAAVTAPLPAVPPLGLWYERVYTRPTALTCADNQTDRPLLRLAGYCEEPTGQIVGWAAQATTTIHSRAQAWSPDYGDFWANINARADIQDFVFESSTILYNLYFGGIVHKLPYTGTSWGTTLPSVSTGVSPSHMITALPEGYVLVGYGATAFFPAAISKDGGATFTPLVQALAGHGDVHVAFDPAFKNNNIIYIADTGTGRVYRNNLAGPIPLRWSDNNLIDATNGAVWCPTGAVPGGFYGLALAYTGGYGQTALYAADNLTDAGVWRTLTPLSGLPKPGIAWDRLTVGITAGVQFMREPYSLKLCGCCTMDTNTTVYALDARNYDNATVGFLWAFTDCVAKKGPTLITEDKSLIGCDPVSGRAQEVNLCWEQLCVAMAYDVEISKVPNFSILVIDVAGEPFCAAVPFVGFWVPDSLLTPCAYFPAGGQAAMAGTSALAQWGNLECGHTYYWRVKVRACVTGQQIRSPWSDVRQFTVKAGLPVTTPYYGPQLLAPNNGCLGCPVKPVSFSWSPFKETMKYKFVLAQDAAMTQVVTEAEVATTAFEYDGTLDYSTNYFWRVMSLEPAPSDWSATFSFQTEAAPAPVTPEKPAPTPVWVWVVIAIGAILVIVTLVLIFKTRRV